MSYKNNSEPAPDGALHIVAQGGVNDMNGTLGYTIPTSHDPRGGGCFGDYWFIRRGISIMCYW